MKATPRLAVTTFAVLAMLVCTRDTLALQARQVVSMHHRGSCLDFQITEAGDLDRLLRLFSGFTKRVFVIAPGVACNQLQAKGLVAHGADNEDPDMGETTVLRNLGKLLLESDGIQLTEATNNIVHVSWATDAKYSERQRAALARSVEPQEIRKLEEAKVIMFESFELKLRDTKNDR